MHDSYARTRLQELIDSSTNVAVNFADYNPDASGVYDATTSFLGAVNKANSITKVTALPVGISIPPGTYIINKSTDLAIPSLVCKGGTAKLIVQDSHSFLIGSNFALSNIQILSTLQYTNSDSSYNPIFKATSTVENVSFTNVLFDSQLSVSDGTARASACIDLQIVNHLRINNMTVKGYRRGFTSWGVSTDIKGDMLHFENVELPIYVQGSDPNYTNTLYAKNIQFTNVSHINTQTQAGNYFKLAGSDTFLFEKCDTINISNVTTEWAVERASYFSSCNNVTCSNYQVKECEAIKFVGYVRNDTGLNNVADTCRITNISLTTLTKADCYLFGSYFSKNVTVKNCSMNGGSIATSFFNSMHYIENFAIENCYAENLKRGFVEFTYYGTIAAVGSIPANPDGNYPAGINGFTSKNNTIRNSHANGFNYNVFKIADVSGINLSAGTYRYSNVHIEKTSVLNSANSSNYGVVVNAYCKGLIDIQDCNNLRILDNLVYGYYLTDGNSNIIGFPFQIRTNCKNVQVLHKEYAGNRDNKYFFGTINVSANTEIEVVTTSRFDTYEDRALITVKHDTADVTTTKDLSQNYRIKGVTTVSNSTDFSLPMAIGYNTAGTSPTYTLPNIMGMLDVVGDSGDFGKYLIGKTGTITLVSGATALFATAATSGKFALIKEASLPRYTLRYQTGAAMSFVMKYDISAA